MLDGCDDVCPAHQLAYFVGGFGVYVIFEIRRTFGASEIESAAQATVIG